MFRQGSWAVHWLARSVGRKRAGKFKHEGIFLHDPVLQQDQTHHNKLRELLYKNLAYLFCPIRWVNIGDGSDSIIHPVENDCALKAHEKFVNVEHIPRLPC